MADTGRWLTVGQAASLLKGMHPETVRRYADDGLLQVYRMARGHRRIWSESAKTLVAVLEMPPGPDRDAALEELRRRNRPAGSGEAAPAAE